MRTWIWHLWLTRACAAFIGIAGLAVLLPSQLDDMMAALADRAWNGFSFHIAWFALALSAWFWSRASLAAELGLPDRDAARRQRPEGLSNAYYSLPRLMFFAGAAIGLGASWRGGAPGWHVAIAVVFGAIGTFLVTFRLRIRQLLNLPEPQRAVPVEQAAGGWWYRHVGFPVARLVRCAPWPNPIAWTALVLSTILLLASVVQTFASLPVGPNGEYSLPVLIGRTFPGPGAALIGLTLAIPLIAAVVRIAESFRIPILQNNWRLPFDLLIPVLMLLTPTVISIHTVRVVTAQGAVQPDERPNLKELFIAWKNNCITASDTTPVRPIIVAVSGGATRAGVWAARVLREVERSATDPATGIFAVSSVSGGSLGTAAWFSALDRGVAGGICRTDGAQRDKARAAATDAALVRLGHDALGPGLAGLIFADAPRAAFGLVAAVVRAGSESEPRGGDRAEAMEHGFAALWRSATDDAVVDKSSGAAWTGGAPMSLEAPYLSLFLNRSDSAVKSLGGPIWIGNTTDSQNGIRVLQVPFKPDMEKSDSVGRSWPFTDAKDALALLGADMPIATVLNNTARFPVLEPTGELAHVGRWDPVNPHFGEKSTQIVDGGYFENEGIMTARELADWLARNAEAILGPGRKIEPILVEATADADADVAPGDVVRCGPVPDDDPSISRGGALPSQALAPLEGLMTVRAAHSDWLLRTARDAYCARKPQAFFHFYLQRPATEDVPLNWILSDHITDYIWHRAIGECGDRQEAVALRAVLAGGTANTLGAR